MFIQRMFSGLVVTLGLMATGCTMETNDGQVGDEFLSAPLDSMGIIKDPEDLPPGSGNGFGPGCFWDSNTISAYRKYGQAALKTNTGKFPANAFIDQLTPDCRTEALTYLVRCALPSSSTVAYPAPTVTDPNHLDYYRGWLNLAPTWETSALVGDNQSWVTACILQHLNGYDLHVDIALQGARPELVITSALATKYPKKDSRTWGNLFAISPFTGGYLPFTAYVCHESDLAGQCNEIPVIDGRICDSDPDCNLSIVGPCSTACTFDRATGYTCGSSGNKNIGSRLMDFSMYPAMLNTGLPGCTP